MLVQVLFQFNFCFSTFNLFLVFCLFFDSTGRAIKNDEQIAPFKLLFPLCKLQPKIELLTYHKMIYLEFLVGFWAYIFANFPYVFVYFHI